MCDGVQGTKDKRCTAARICNGGMKFHIWRG